MDVEKELEETIKEIEEAVFSIPLSPREATEAFTSSSKDERQTQ